MASKVFVSTYFNLTDIKHSKGKVEIQPVNCILKTNDYIWCEGISGVQTQFMLDLIYSYFQFM